jgi:DNA (cytosine-5)-methyltransferase 1
VSATVTDLFCGAGGSSLGAELAGAQLVMAANHWQTAIDVHQVHFPDAGHDVADISQADPRRYPVTDILLASPECTNHSQARGVTRRKQDATLFDSADLSAERSRATMWDVVRFAEQINYSAIIVENVVEATKWVLWPAWWQAMESLGYTGQLTSHNSMHHGVPQSRDRIYVVWSRKGLKPDLEYEMTGACPNCETVRTCRQQWKNGRRVGRHGQQWYWGCVHCGSEVTTELVGAQTIIDWDLDCPRIGDRVRPLAQRTRDRIYAGLERHGWVPITTAGAGATFETTPGNRAASLLEPVPTQQTTATTALALPPDHVLFQTAHGGRLRSLDEPHATVTASDDRWALLSMRRNGSITPPSEPVGTVSAGGNHHALLMRNNTGLAEMVTPVTEPARTMTTAGHQSLLVPYDRTGQARPVTDPAMTMTTRERAALLDPAEVVDDCGFRMLEPYEVARAMAFEDGYIPRDLTKKDQVRLAGNAVTPPVMEFLMGRTLQSLEAAA